ncbi:MAG: trypsin-like peptidase domain-containing protein [Desulfovibrio sp.]|nr:trypsin-like peptidase domain-containing protein [Desulfovibrio sp.]
MAGSGLAQKRTPAPNPPVPNAPAQVQQPAPSPPAPAAALPDDPRRTPVVRVVQEAGPAVVSIISAREVKAPFAPESLLQRFFGDSAAQQAQKQPPKPRTAQNLGSGVIIDGRKGYVLTNAHVITGATQITARLQDGREFTAHLQGADQDMDLAVLRLELAKGEPPLPQVRMGDSASLMIGEPVVAIGNPYGLSHTVTTGVVSALDRSISNGQQTFAGLIQTDAAINPGNSGGPLLNILGQVVGINAAVFARGGGLSFAIPINKAKGVLDELIATGRVAHIWLGLLGVNMTPEQAAAYGLPKPGGMVVTEVFPGTPAEKAGIRPGDALLAMGGQKVQDKAQFLGLLLGFSRGDCLDVLLNRAGQQFQVQMRPQVLERDAGLGLIAWRWGFTPGSGAGMAAAAAPTSPGQAKTPGVEVASVKAEGPAARLGLKPGDVILQIGTLRTATEADLLSAFYRYQMHTQLILSVQRGEQVYTVRMKI